MSKALYGDQSNAAYVWWQSLRPQHVDGGRIIPGDRGTIARLKRASSVMGAAAEPATAKLFTDLFGEQYRQSGRHPEFAVRHLPRAAVIAGVLAHVSDHQKHGTLARAIGPTEPKDPSSARLKPLRFKRLLAARSPDEVLTQFRRAVAMLDHTANVRDLALQLLAWTDDERGDIARTRFAFDYYDAEKFAPAATETTAANDIDKD